VNEGRQRDRKKKDKCPPGVLVEDILRFSRQPGVFVQLKEKKIKRRSVRSPVWEGEEKGGTH